LLNCIWEDKHVEVAISDHNHELTEQNEGRSKEHCHLELDKMFQVEQESMPGSKTERLSSDSYISKSRFIDVITDVFDALKNGLSARNDAFHDLIVATQLFSLLGHVHKY